MPQKSESNDLNPYELQRLENIRNNEEFLRSIGIGFIKQEIQEQAQRKQNDNLKERKRKINALESSSRIKKEKIETTSSVPLRRSRRVSGSGVVPSSPLSSPPREEDPRGYADMPLVSC